MEAKSEGRIGEFIGKDGVYASGFLFSDFVCDERWKELPATKDVELFHVIVVIVVIVFIIIFPSCGFFFVFPVVDSVLWEFSAGF